MPTPENYAKTLSQLDHLRAEVVAMHRNVMEQEMRLADLEFDKVTKTMLEKCRTDIDAAKKALLPLMDRVAEVTRRVYGFGPDTDDRARALRSCQGKKQYRSPEGAGAAATSAKTKGSTDELRIYKCDICWSYHLTSVPLATFADRAAGTRGE